MSGFFGWAEFFGSGWVLGVRGGEGLKVEVSRARDRGEEGGG